MNCPKCNTKDCYIGLNVVECSNSACEDYKPIDSCLGVKNGCYWPSMEPFDKINQKLCDQIIKDADAQIMYEIVKSSDTAIMVNLKYIKPAKYILVDFECLI